MATPRMRKPFQFPMKEGEDDADIPMQMDEEEQEQFIERLKRVDEEHNDTYKVGKRRGHQRSMFTGFQRVFLIVPLISAVAFIPSLLTSRLVQVKIIDLLAITSSICTASVLMFMPNSKPQDAELSYLGRPIDANTGPLERYIDYLNGGLTLLVLPNAFLYRGTQGVHEGFWSICVLPFVAFLMIILARRVLLEVNIQELQQLKYGYKGA